MKDDEFVGMVATMLLVDKDPVRKAGWEKLWDGIVEVANTPSPSSKPFASPDDVIPSLVSNLLDAW